MLDLLGTRWEDFWAGTEEPDARGAVYTRAEVVRLILDLAGYRVDGARRLAAYRVLEPGCGDGAFISAMVERLIVSERCHGDGVIDWQDPVFDASLRAVDIHPAALVRARQMITEQLASAGCPKVRADSLARQWTVHADFLLHDWPSTFDFVVGNPPYLRIEEIPKAALAQYRSSFATLTDRADLFVAFVERGLELLSSSGALAFICANRFAKNQYGAAIRRQIARSFRVRVYLNLEHTQPFVRDVSAYPAILVIDRDRGAATMAGTLTDVHPITLDQVRTEAIRADGAGPFLSRFNEWYSQGEPWISTCHDERDELDRRYAHLPALEDSAPATKVGIGVATGADRVFVLRGDSCGVESECLLPLARVSDVANEGVRWSGSYLVNPFSEADDGALVDLAQFPGFARYMTSHAEKLKSRHVARARPHAWYRTIDRVWRGLHRQPKLLIPDIQSTPTIAFDDGTVYPHHNLYWITSEGWNLRALQALLRSDLVYQQVKAHSVQMRGGSLRWQAQTLRRVRVPHFSSLCATLVNELAQVSASDDVTEINRLAEKAFSVE